MKKIILAIRINLVALLTLILNTYEFVIRAIINMFSISLNILYLCGFLSGVLIISFIIMTPEMWIVYLFWAIILLFLWLFIFRFYDGLSEVIINLLSALESIPLMVKLQEKYHKLLVRYLEKLDIDKASKFEKYHPFLITIAMHYINKVLVIILKVIRITLYISLPTWMVGFHVLLDYKDANNLFISIRLFFEGIRTATKSDLAITFGFSVVFLITGIVFADCLAKSIKNAIENYEALVRYFSAHLDLLKMLLGKERFNSKSTDNNNATSNEETTEKSSKNIYYDILSKATNLQELKQIFRNLCKEIHPDVSSLDQKESNEKMAMLNEAYSELRKKFANT